MKTDQQHNISLVNYVIYLMKRDIELFSEWHHIPLTLINATLICENEYFLQFFDIDKRIKMSLGSVYVFMRPTEECKEYVKLLNI